MSARARVPEKGFYVHYKHDPQLAPHDHMYEVVGLARNTEEQTYSVLYRPLYENNWLLPANYQSRPLEMFLESVEVDGVLVPRFTKISDPDLIRELTIVRDRMYPRA
jgi:hypothetical protein